MAEKNLIECCTTRGYCLYLKLYRRSLLANIMTILWLGTLVLIKPESLLAGNTINQTLEKMLRPMSRAATFVYRLKQSNISPMRSCRHYQYQPLDRRTS